MAEMKTPQECLAAIAEKDPTGEARILDCKHGFRDMLIVKARVKWHLIYQANLPDCPGCKVPLGSHIMSHIIDYCPCCGASLASPGVPVRNYVIGSNVPADEHLLRLGAFDTVGIDALYKKLETGKDDESLVPA